MILGFKTHYPKFMTKGGHETFFKEKIKYGEKIHTIRKGHRWKAGMIIHAATGVRTKHYNCFQTMKCVSVQNIEIRCCDDGPPDISIDNKNIYAEGQLLLSKKDGFESRNDFIQWFNAWTENFEGQIIHWTDFKY